MKIYKDAFRPTLQVMFLSLLLVILCGTLTDSSLHYTEQRPQSGNKLNAAGEQAHDLPPRVFPSTSDEDNAPNRQGEQLPPLRFPAERVYMSQEQHDVIHISKKSTENLAVSVTEETSTQKSASEVKDLLNPYVYNIPVYEGGTEGPGQDTMTVTGPNVVNNGRTHEEDIIAPIVENKENGTTNSSLTDALLTSDTNETAFDSLNVSTITGNNVSSTEDFLHSENITEVTGNEENGTSPVDALEENNVTQADKAVKVDDRKQSVSEKNVEDKEEIKSDIETVKNETTAKTESNTTVEDETTAKTESNTTVEDEIIAKTESNTTIEDEITAKTESNTTIEDKITAKTASNKTIEDEITTKTESNTTIAGEIIAKTESSSTTQEQSTIKFTSTLPVQHSTVTTLQPTLKAESTTSIDISENLIDHKAEDTPVAMAASQNHADHSHASSGKSSAFLQPTESAGILAAVFVGIALIGYVGLLIWRRILEKRYGNREMLVNEDDFYDTNDMRNFEL